MPAPWNIQKRAVGTGVLKPFTAQAATSAGRFSARFDLGHAYSQWALRVRLSGAATSGECQLLGTVATSSDPNAALRPLTTWLGSVNSSDDTVFVTGKPCTSVICQITTPSSSNTTWDAWAAATL